MTMNYVGILPESSCKGRKYERRFLYSKWRNGKLVNYYEVVEMVDESPIVPLNNQIIKKLSEYSFI